MAENWTIEVYGVEESARAFRHRAGKLTKIVKPVLLRLGDRVIHSLQEGYQTRGNPDVYVRTGTYGRKMQKRHRVTRRGITVNVYNLTPYAKWVGVERTQARVHRHVWPTDMQVLRGERPRVLKELSGALIRGLT